MSYNEDDYYSHGNEGEVFPFMIVFGVIVGWAVSLAGWDAILNYPERKKLMDQYAHSGVEVRAMLMAHHITRNRMNFVVTRRTHEITYVYKPPSDSATSALVVKKQRTVFNSCMGFLESEIPTQRVFPVLVLAGHPKSGLPKARIDSFDESFGADARVCRIVLMVLGIPFGTLLFAGGIPGWPAALLVGPILFTFLGLCCALATRNGWRKTILESGQIHRGESASPEIQTAEAVIMEEGEDGSGVPLARAVAVPENNVEMARARPVKKPRVPLPDPLAETIYQESLKMSFQTLLGRLDEFRGAGKWNLRASYVRLAAESWPQKTLVPLQECPDTAVGNLFKGVYLIHRSWDVRGCGTADTVSSSSAGQFLRGLNEAREALLRSASQDAEDPTPFALLGGAVSMGLQVPKAQAVEWFEAAIARDPQNTLAYAGRFNLVCKKWGGSHEEMKEFAREAPDPILILSSLFEAWLWHNSFERDVAEATRFRTDPAIVDETMKIYKESIAPEAISDLSFVSRHSTAVEWLIRCRCSRDAVQSELEKLRPWRSALRGNSTIVSAMDNPVFLALQPNVATILPINAQS